MRREKRFEFGHWAGLGLDTRKGGPLNERHSGIDLVVTRKGIEVRGFYDSFVGLSGGDLSWEVIDSVRARVEGKTPLHENDRIEKVVRDD